MDYQNRVGSKPGAGQASSTQAAIARRERLRRLAMETIDLTKDPYLMKNNMGSYECKLCLTLHPNEGSYLSHTQGKKHQTNLSRRAQKPSKPEAQPQKELAQLEAKKQNTLLSGQTHAIKIGRPGYKVTKVKDADTNQLGLLFQIHYPQIASDNVYIKPLHRFMSAFEQRREPPNRAYQYLLVAAAPYETIAFKIPSQDIDRGPGRFWAYWDADVKQYTLQLLFKPKDSNK